MKDDFDDSALFDPNYKSPDEFDDSVIFSPDYQAPEVKQPERGDFMSGVYSGANSFMSLMNYSKAAIGALTDNEDWMKEGIKTAQGYEEKAAEYGQGRVTDWDSVNNAGDFVDYFQYGLGTLVPYAGESMVAGVIGGVAGSAAAPGVGTVTGTLGGMVAKQALKETIKRYTKGKLKGLSKDQIEKKIRKNFKEYAEGKILPSNRAMVESAMKRTSAKMGATMGSMTATLPIGQGDVASNMIEKDDTLTKESAQLATGLAIPYAALDVLPEFIGISRLLNPAGGGMLKRGATGFISQAPIEAATEVAQEEINIRTRAAHDPDYDPMGREAFVQRRESVIMGGMGGGVFGAATGLLGKGDADINNIELDVATNIQKIDKSEFDDVNDYNQTIIDGIYDSATELTGDVNTLETDERKPLDPNDPRANQAMMDAIIPEIGQERRGQPVDMDEPLPIGQKIDQLYNEAVKSGGNINQYIIDGLYGKAGKIVDHGEQQRPAPLSTEQENQRFMETEPGIDAKEEYLGGFPVEQQTTSIARPAAPEDYDREHVETQIKELGQEANRLERAGSGQTVPNSIAASGGIDWDEAIAQGLDPADMKAVNKKGMPFGKPLFRRGGQSFDEAAEAMGEAGLQAVMESVGAKSYEELGHSSNALIELIGDFTRGGEPVLMPADEAYHLQLQDDILTVDNLVEQYEAQLSEIDEYEQIQATQGAEAAEDYFYGNRAMDLYSEMEATGELVPEEVLYNGNPVTAETQFDEQGEALSTLIEEAAAVNPELAEKEFERLVDESDADIAKAMYAIISGEADETVTEEAERDGTGGVAPVPAEEAEEAGRRQEARPVAEEHRVGDRRTHPADRKRVSEMSEAEKSAALLTNEKSGLRNERAYGEDQRLAHQSFFDIDNFKQINDEYTYDGADLILAAFGEIMAAAGNENIIPYHLHGDEFIVQSDSFPALKAFSEEVQQKLNDIKVTIELPSGETKVASNIGASYGIAETKEQAEANLKRDKAARAGAGLRTEREREPGGLPEQAAEGYEDREGHVTAEPEIWTGEINGQDAEVNINPTEDQIAAGNYQKAHIDVQGMRVSIETPAGIKRKPKWPVMAAHYGYIRDTIGADSETGAAPHEIEQVDISVNPDVEVIPDDNPVYIINQYIDGKFDEVKVQAGFPTSDAASKSYIAGYTKGWKGLKSIHELSIEEFKSWLDTGDMDAEYHPVKNKGSEAKPVAAVGTAPEHLMIGVDDRELSQIVEEFGGFQEGMFEDGQSITNIFVAPKKKEVVRLLDKVRVYNKEHGWMSVKEAAKKIDEWEQNALDQNANEKIRNENGDKVVLSLFDLSGKWSLPWEQAGYQVYRFDIQDSPDVGDVNNFSTEFFGDWFGDFEGKDIYAILAACPCTDFAVSGARHFAAKDADGRTVASVNLVHQTLRTIEYFKPQIWALENPVGRIEKLGGLPPWRLSFDPNHLGEAYTKKTIIWGRFNADLPIAPVEPTEGSKMHKKYGGKSQKTKNARSVTPDGFAYGFFQANNAHDHPIIEVANKFDRLDRDLIQEALDAGVTPEQINRAVEDFYYMDLDDDAANEAIQELIDDNALGAFPIADYFILDEFEYIDEKFKYLGEGRNGVRIYQTKDKSVRAYVPKDDRGNPRRQAAAFTPDVRKGDWSNQGESLDNFKLLTEIDKDDLGAFPGMESAAPKEITNVRGYSFAIVVGDEVFNSGSIPTKIDADSELASITYYKDLADQVDGDLYLSSTTQVDAPVSDDQLIFGHTWKQIEERQQRINISESVRSKIPDGAVMVYSSKDDKGIRGDAPTSQTDLLGDDVSALQTEADAKRVVDEKLSGTKDVPMSAGKGDLFGDAHLQADIEGEIAREEESDRATWPPKPEYHTSDKTYDDKNASEGEMDNFEIVDENTDVQVEYFHQANDLDKGVDAAPYLMHFKFSGKAVDKNGDIRDISHSQFVDSNGLNVTLAAAIFNTADNTLYAAIESGRAFLSDKTSGVAYKEDSELFTDNETGETITPVNKGVIAATFEFPDGSVQSRNWDEVTTLEAPEIPDTGITDTKDVVAGEVDLSQLPDDVRTQIEEDTEGINPKIAALVIELNNTGITTTMSGDLYGDDLAYVDLAPQFADALEQASDAGQLPMGWMDTYSYIPMTRMDILDEQMSAAEDAVFDNFVQVNKRIRLAKFGAGTVSQEDAYQIARAIHQAAVDLDIPTHTADKKIKADGGRWYVSGEPGVDPRAGELGVSLGYESTDDGDRIRVRFDDGDEVLFSPHQLLPESAAPQNALESEAAKSAFESRDDKLHRLNAELTVSDKRVNSLETLLDCVKQG